jgi:hypothetical protein
MLLMTIDAICTLSHFSLSAPDEPPQKYPSTFTQTLRNPYIREILRDRRDRSYPLQSRSICLNPRSQTMPDSIMYQEEEHYVVLEADRPEEFLSAPELLAKLSAILTRRQDDLPRELQKFSTVAEQARYLLENHCEFDVAPGHFLQWYVVRLEK